MNELYSDWSSVASSDRRAIEPEAKGILKKQAGKIGVMKTRTQARPKEPSGAKREARPRREPKTAQERLVLAAFSGSAARVASALRDGADPVTASPLPAFRKNMNRCLVWFAGQSGNLKCLKTVLESLPEELARAKLPEALAVAAWKAGSKATLTFLAESPPAWIDRAELAQSLSNAIKKGNTEAVMAFTAALGPDAVIEPKTGDTALLWALRHASVQAARVLLPVSDLTLRDAEGNTALMLAFGAAPHFLHNVFSLSDLGGSAESIGAVNHAGQSVIDIIHGYPPRLDKVKAELVSILETVALQEASASATKASLKIRSL